MDYGQKVIKKLDRFALVGWFYRMAIMAKQEYSIAFGQMKRS